jgi:hypothetical protein
MAYPWSSHDILTASDLNDAIATAIVSTGLGAWQTFTPTYSNVTVGTTGLVNTGRYTKIGRLCVAHYALTFGTGGSVTGNMTVFYPVTAQVSSQDHMGNAYGTLSTTRKGGTVVGNGTSNFVIRNSSDGALWAATSPFTWAAGATFSATVIYESAS